MTQNNFKRPRYLIFCLMFCLIFSLMAVSVAAAYSSLGATVVSYSINENGAYRLEISHASPGTRVNFNIVTEYWHAGALVDTTTVAHYVDPGWVDSFHWGNNTWKNDAARAPGTYTVKAIIDGKEVASGTFTIEETKGFVTENNQATVTFDDGRVTIDLTTDGEADGNITLSRFSVSDKAAPPSLEPAGLFMNIERSLQQREVTVNNENPTILIEGGGPTIVQAVVKVDIPALPAGMSKDSLDLYRFNTGTGNWDKLNGTIVGNQIWVTLEDFSLFGLFGTVAAVAPAPAPTTPAPTTPAPTTPAPTTPAPTTPAPTQVLPRTAGDSFPYAGVFAGILVIMAGILLVRKNREIIG
ncbi:hypothetical protein [Candidatus Contubernalis alkaliaceticus]|uniref:hypothetical protein n=1 Tax=Candidatus Contubernalis alkaliaceticus TaxID=338645 RepID=UPI001F4C269B|nr:hypothetical protein [Candidatus Contubernalis alkalaceticus]